MAYPPHRSRSRLLASSLRLARNFFGAFLLLNLLCLNPSEAARPEPRPGGVAFAALQEPPRLVQGRDSDVEMAGGARDLYQVAVGRSQYLRVVVEQHGIILSVTLTDPAGAELVRMDNPSGAYGPIYVSAVSGPGGDYRLEVQSKEAWANAGRYVVRIEELRPAIPADGARVSAEKSFADGRRLLEDPKATQESRSTALRKLEESLAYWREVGDRHWVALTEFCVAVAHRGLGDRQAAERHFERSLAVEVAEYDWRLRASVLNDIGANHFRLGNLELALKFINDAFRVYHGHQDRRGQASTLTNLGSVHLAAGRFREAAASFQQARPLRQAENDRGGEAILINNIVSVSERLGEPHVALEGYRRALEIWQELASRGQLNNPDVTLAAGFNNVALAYDRLGEWQLALEHYEKALSLLQAAAPVEAAKTHDNIGELYAVLGDTHMAMKHFDRARSLAAGKDPGTEANVLSHIGQIYVSEGKLSGARAYFEQALALRKNDHEKANELTNIGVVHILQGSLRKALESYDQVLKLNEAGNNPRGLALALHRKAEAHAHVGEHAQAFADFSRALPLWKAVADRRGEAATLHGLALIERGRGNLSEALSRSRQSLDIIESLRAKVASQRLRSSFFESQQNNYELHLDLRMRLYRRDGSPEHLAATLEASELARARSLVDTLTEARANISRGISEELVRQERDAQQRLNEKARVQTEVLNRKHSAQEAAVIEREVNDAIAEYDAVKARIRASSPTYARLTQPHSLSLREIQQLLDEDTLLLEYFLGEERSYLWLVSNNSIVGFDSLPKRSEIEDAARAFHQSLAEPPSGPPARGGSAASRAALSQTLLGPVAELVGRKRLLIVGDGVLHYLPFGALPAPRPRAGAKSANAPGARPAPAPYLIEEHELVYLPSASALAVLRAEPGEERKPASLSVAVLADPVFDSEDWRLKAPKGSPPPGGKSLAADDSSRAGAGPTVLRSGLKLVPLPGTQKEAFSIRDAVPPPGRTETFLGFEASRATVLKLQDGAFQVIHFATHGDLDAEHPELSSIVLSMHDADGGALDGYLRLHDIYNLKLPAELVVLSACQTGMGRIIKGEGLVGLTRGFMYAGSPRVVASLWRVGDDGTSELMKRFYQHLAGGEMSPPAALRQSQIDLLRGRRWRSPYHWAGFVLQGEWKPIR